MGQRTSFTNNPSWVRPNTRHGSNNNINTGNRRQETQTNSQSPDVTDEELREFSETLLTKDVNNAAKYVTINLQGKTTSRSNKDEAPLP